MSEIQVWSDFAWQLAAARGEEFVRDFCRTLADEQRAEEEMAFSRQQRVAAASAAIDSAWLDGLGECHMRLDPEVFFHWVKKEGRDCWNDKNFIHEFKRDNPDVRVRNRSRKSFIVRP
jgi:hypothetical protein